MLFVLYLYFFGLILVWLLIRISALARISSRTFRLIASILMLQVLVTLSIAGLIFFDVKWHLKSPAVFAAFVVSIVVPLILFLVDEYRRAFRVRKD